MLSLQPKSITKILIHFLSSLNIYVPHPQFIHWNIVINVLVLWTLTFRKWFMMIALWKGFWVLEWLSWWSACLSWRPEIRPKPSVNVCRTLLQVKHWVNGERSVFLRLFSQSVYPDGQQVLGLMRDPVCTKKTKQTIAKEGEVWLRKKFTVNVWFTHMLYTLVHSYAYTTWATSTKQANK